MRKIVLDFSGLKTRNEIHEYLAEKMEFPEYYGRNLDALYDCLTDISEPTAIACRLPLSGRKEGQKERDDAAEYLQRVLRTMMEAEEENGNLAFFICESREPGSDWEETAGIRR